MFKIIFIKYLYRKSLALLPLGDIMDNLLIQNLLGNLLIGQVSFEYLTLNHLICH